MGLWQPKHARLGVAALRQGRNGSNFNKAKSHRAQAVNATGVFVQARGQAHPVGKAQSRQGYGVAHRRIGVRMLQRRSLGSRDGSKGEVVRGFGV